MSKFLSLLPTNMTLYGKIVFAYLIKNSDMRSSWTGDRGTNAMTVMTVFFIRRKDKEILKKVM